MKSNRNKHIPIFLTGGLINGKSRKFLKEAVTYYLATATFTSFTHEPEVVNW